jgi:hypothetical protein
MCGDLLVASGSQSIPVLVGVGEDTEPVEPDVPPKREVAEFAAILPRCQAGLSWPHKQLRCPLFRRMPTPPRSTGGGGQRLSVSPLSAVDAIGMLCVLSGKVVAPPFFCCSTTTHTYGVDALCSLPLDKRRLAPLPTTIWGSLFVRRCNAIDESGRGRKMRGGGGEGPTTRG